MRTAPGAQVTASQPTDGDRIAIGVLSDLHHEPLPARPRSWINRYEPERVEARVAAALGLFAGCGVDVILLLGDLTETGDDAALAAVDRWFAGAPAPVAAVLGNHDGPRGAVSVRRLPERPLTVRTVAVTGIDAVPVEPGSPLFEADAVPRLGPGPATVVASHYPILSLAGRLAAAGLPYPGDLVDRAAIHDALAAWATPVVVLNGHVHARCSVAAGSVLQLAVGALIEPPFDCTVVTVTASPRTAVRRVATRLGPSALVDPVFAPEEELWTYESGGWLRSEPAQAAAPRSHSNTSAALRSGGNTG